MNSWNAEVVYGDTDSVFVLLRGRSKDEAFKIGEEIANHITSLSPKDVLLKLEKVYKPCILVTKKVNLYEFFLLLPFLKLQCSGSSLFLKKR